MPRGLTLIELLAVLVILAIAATLTLGMSGTSHAQRQLSAESAVLETLSRARVAAATSGGATIRFGENLIVHALGNSDPESRAGVEWQVALPEGWTSALEPSTDQATLFVDALGCTRDAMIVVQDSGVRCRLRLEGLSGRLTRESDPFGGFQ